MYRATPKSLVTRLPTLEPVLGYGVELSGLSVRRRHRLLEPVPAGWQWRFVQILDDVAVSDRVKAAGVDT